ncbi:8791_t:CDS:2 [Diversispora eburnea]|uniref:8791_t:CDS:1 n=1 Tax=Diversispora eburnea TaxID=1213867 RepID=A0A9N9C417_9GLOM|nr:8791_t:CDS:2 [Diversispora eburnea]
MEKDPKCGYMKTYLPVLFVKKNFEKHIELHGMGQEYTAVSKEKDLEEQGNGELTYPLQNGLRIILGLKKKPKSKNQRTILEAKKEETWDMIKHHWTGDQVRLLLRILGTEENRLDKDDQQELKQAIRNSINNWDGFDLRKEQEFANNIKKKIEGKGKQPMYPRKSESSNEPEPPYQNKEQQKNMEMTLLKGWITQISGIKEPEGTVKEALDAFEYLQ